MRCMLYNTTKDILTISHNFKLISEVAISQAKNIEEKDKTIADLEEKLRESKKRLSDNVENAREKKRHCRMAELDAEYFKSELGETNEKLKKILGDLDSVRGKIETVLAN